MQYLNFKVEIQYTTVQNKLRTITYYMQALTAEEAVKKVMLRVNHQKIDPTSIKLIQPTVIGVDTVPYPNLNH
jgi:hypothetical protein